MSVGEVEQKIADRFHDLFHSSWARAAGSLVTMLISIWLYVAAWENRHSPGRLPRPLTWWRVQLAQVGIHYPHWLNTVTDWHAPHGGSVVLLALAVGAVGATAGAGRSGAPGFNILALLALTLNAQWFGLGRTIEIYGKLVALLVIVALGMAFRSWSIDHRRIVVERSGMHFSTTTIGYGLVNGPVGVVLLPIIYPIILVSKAVRTLGYDRDRQGGSHAIEFLQNELRELEQSANSLSDLPAARAARLFATVQLIAASPVMSRKALDMLNLKLPSGAAWRPGMADPVPAVLNFIRKEVS
jgi:hypothetical protein